MRHKGARGERVKEWMLPPAERRAARLGREAEEQIRRERDWHCERSRQLAHVAAESSKWSFPFRAP